MILNRILSLCGQSCIGRIGLLSLLIGLSNGLLVVTDN